LSPLETTKIDKLSFKYNKIQVQLVLAEVEGIIFMVLAICLEAPGGGGKFKGVA
jgi:hypothetical protein